ncbi:MAG: NAD(P)H-hydrate dehydratase [Flavobacteriales bacterium]|nr:NAD(P)H-hydrate dehydratase [Flavobacteriales bacterium]
MKILTAKQIRALDKFTIENEPIDAIDLMERAAKACLEYMPMTDASDEDHILFVCGKGNNGGDGLAMARLEAKNSRSRVKVVVLEYTEHGSPNFSQNLYWLKEEGDVEEVIHVRDIEDFPEIQENTVVVDAIMGTGLSRPLDGLLADAVHHLNARAKFVLSVDIPSGLFAEDNTGNAMENVVQADWTVTFHCPKMSFLNPLTGNYVGELFTADIGLMADAMKVESPYQYVDLAYVNQFVKKRPKFSHKGNYGHALLLAGSKGKMGAAELAALACLKSGAGLVTAHVPACGLDIMQTAVAEVMCSVDSNADFLIDLPKLNGFNAIGIGPGIGTEKDTANVLKRLIQDASAHLVVDADGLNILAENKTWYSFLPKGTILTPHPKEFERLVGKWSSFEERMQLQIDFSKKYSVTVVLKGAYTCITTPAGEVFFNSTGNPGMATAGSGDVLTGMILGLLAQGYSPEQSAILGTFLHGSAGDHAADFLTENAVLARDIISTFGAVFHLVFGKYSFRRRMY